MMGFQNDTSQKVSINERTIANNKKYLRLRKQGYFHGPPKKANVSFLQSPSLKSFVRSLTRSKSALAIQSVDFHLRTFLSSSQGRLVELFKRTRSIKKFKAAKDWNEIVTRLALNKLSRCFAKYYFIRSYDLNLLGCNNLHTCDLIRLGKALSRSQKLNSVTLSLVSCNKVSIQGFQDLLFRLSKVKSLRNLTLDLGNIKILKEGDVALDFERTLGKLNQLQRLVLKMNSCVLREGMQSLAKSLWNKQNLKYLELELGDTSLEDQGIKHLGDALAGLQDLEDLNLQLWGNGEIGDEGMLHLGENLGGCWKLKNLEMNLSRCSQIMEFGFGALFKGIGNLHQLEKLSLSLFSTQVPGQNIYQLEQALLTMNNLRELELNLSSCPLLDDSLFERLAKSLMIKRNWKTPPTLSR